MKLKPARLLVLLFAAAALPVFAQNIAVVNGKPIPSSRADVIVKQMAAQGQQDSPQLRELVKENLITQEILIQEADKLGLTDTPEAKTQLEMARQSIALRALQADFVKKNPISDSEIKAEYDRIKAEYDKTTSRDDGKEYLARHILVDNEADAKAIIAKLKGGAKFEELAKQSKDPGSASKGGELDWAKPSTYVEPFSKALVGLQKGKITETPVKTEYGYHVIKLENIRTAKAAGPEEKFPTLEQVKPRISEMLQQKKLQAYQEELRKKAKVQ
jgi:peptidyl-prolyl cis-trans isomerase C